MAGGHYPLELRDHINHSMIGEDQRLLVHIELTLEGGDKCIDLFQRVAPRHTVHPRLMTSTIQCGPVEIGKPPVSAIKKTPEVLEVVVQTVGALVLCPPED